MSLGLIGQCCGPCVEIPDCVPTGREVFGFEGALFNANGYFPWSPSRPTVTDSTGPILLTVSRRPENSIPAQYAGAQYDCDGNYVLAVTEMCVFRAYFGSVEDKLTNGIVVNEWGGSFYYVHPLTNNFHERLYAANHPYPWKFLDAVGTANEADNGDKLYLAWADDEAGAGFTQSFNSGKLYMALLRSATPLTPVEADFAGQWKTWKPVNPEYVVNGQRFVAKTGHLVFHAKAQYVPAAPCAPLGWNGNGPTPPVTGFVTYPDFGTRAASVDYATTRDACGCSHLLPDASGTLNFAAGEYRKQFTMAVEDHDAPQWWGCEGNYPGGLMSGYESGVVTLDNLVHAGFDAYIASPTANVSVICEHDPGPPLNFQVQRKEINALFTGAGGFRAWTMFCDPQTFDGFQGLWDAGANRPRLADAGIIYYNNENQAGLPMQLQAGSYLRVAGVGDNFTLDGESGWAVGDVVYFDGTAWTRQASDYRDGGKYLMKSWRRGEMSGSHLEEQPQGSGTIVSVNDHALTEYWQRSYPFIKEYDQQGWTVFGGGGGEGGPQCQFGNGVTGSTDEETYTWTYTDNGTVQQTQSGTLSLLNSDTEDITTVEGLLALGNFSDPATLGGVWGIQPGDIVDNPEAAQDSDAIFGDGSLTSFPWEYALLPLGYNGAVVAVLNQYQGTDIRAIAARARWIDGENRKTYVMRRSELTATWNNSQKPNILTHIYLNVAVVRLGDASPVSSYRVELFNGVPYVVEPPDEWGCIALFGFESESEFLCHPGQP